jgi:tetratricopeptide (TPR) repeat protein
MRRTIFATLCLTLQTVVAQTLSVADLVNRGASYAKQNDYTEAIVNYQKALAIDSDYIPAQVDLGLAYFKTAQYTNAIAWLEKAAGQGVDSNQIHTLLAMSLYSTKQYRPASLHFKVLFDREPANTSAQYFLAESYLRSHRSRELSELFRELETKSPNSPIIHMIAGERYDQLDRVPEALDEFKRAAAMDPRIPFVHFALGYLYWEQHQFDKATTEFRQEIRVPNGEADQANGYLADIAFHSDERSAEQLLRSAAANDSNVRIAQYDLGIIRSKQKRLREAAAYFSKAIELDPQRADAYYRLAKVCRELGEAERANQLLRKVTALHTSEHVSITRTIAPAPPASAVPLN